MTPRPIDRWCAFLALILLALPVGAADAGVRLPALLADGVILQRDAAVTLWGWTEGDGSVEILLDDEPWARATAVDGEWRVDADARPAGGPHTLSFRGDGRVDLEDVWFGDVWLASGQSNMEYPMSRLEDEYADAIAAADLPTLRQFKVSKAWDFEGPRDDVDSDGWMPSTPSNVLGFSAVAFFFGRDIHDRYDIPVGIINASFGGSPAEGWMSEDDLAPWPHYLDTARKWRNDETLTAVRQRDQARNDRWHADIDARDEGLAASPRWSATNVDDEDWSRLVVPGDWADTDTGHLNGVVWFRRHVDLPAQAAGEPATLRLGRIVDADETWVNGMRVGATTYQYPQRRYEIPAGVLREGDNVIAVRVVNSAGSGGFVADKPYRLDVGERSFDLTGPWRMRVGAEADALAPPEFQEWSQPLGYYNAMLAPLHPMTIKGVIWYQGESNVKDPAEYAELFPAMIRAWRKHWNQGTFPFIFVQLANFLEVSDEPTESAWAETRDAQAAALALPDTAMATAIDLGEWNDIHPLDKRSVGERLALAARRLAYGEKDLVASGPSLSGVETRGRRLVLTFDHVGGGLVARGGSPEGFAIAAEHGDFRWAKARIVGDTVEVWHPDIEQPTRVRYAWADNPDTANLYNAEGLPATPFSIEGHP